MRGAPSVAGRATFRRSASAAQSSSRPAKLARERFRRGRRAAATRSNLARVRRYAAIDLAKRSSRGVGRNGNPYRAARSSCRGALRRRRLRGLRRDGPRVSRARQRRDVEGKVRQREAAVRSTRSCSRRATKSNVQGRPVHGPRAAERHACGAGAATSNAHAAKSLRGEAALELQTPLHRKERRGAGRRGCSPCLAISITHKDDARSGLSASGIARPPP